MVKLGSLSQAEGTACTAGGRIGGTVHSQPPAVPLLDVTKSLSVLRILCACSNIVSYSIYEKTDTFNNNCD